jgi:hypothetical protein
MSGTSELQEDFLRDGSPVRMIESGRTGEIVDHDPNDQVLPYKIKFDDDSPPNTAWVKKEHFVVESRSQQQPEEHANEEATEETEVNGAATLDAFLESAEDAPTADTSAARGEDRSEDPGLVEAESPVVDQPQAEAVTGSEELCPTHAGDEAESLAEPSGDAARELDTSSTHQQAATSAAPEAEAVSASKEAVVVSTIAPTTTTEGTSVSSKSYMSAEVVTAKAMDNVSIYKEAVMRLNEQLADVQVVKEVAQWSRLPPLVVVIAGAASIAAFCLWGFCGQLASTLLGVILPAFESFKCVEEFSNIKDPSEMYTKASAMQFWLIYWVVAGIFLSVEYMFYYVLIWVPMYYPTKLSVLLWLYLPQTRGANHVYHWVVAPTLRRNRRHIDAAIDNSTKHLKRGVSGALTNVTMASMSASAGGLGQLTNFSRSLVAQGVKKLSKGNTQEFMKEESQGQNKTD